VALNNSQLSILVIPAKAGIQFPRLHHWTPAFAGVTTFGKPLAMAENCLEPRSFILNTFTLYVKRKKKSPVRADA